MASGLVLPRDSDTQAGDGPDCCLGRKPIAETDR